MPATRLQSLGQRNALMALVLVFLAMAALLLAATRYAPPPSASGDRHGDSATYERIVDRMKAGEGYYPAAHEELIANGYGTRSVFNWRTPFYPTLLSLSPSIGVAQGVLAGLGLVAALMLGYLTLRSADALTTGLAGFALALSLATYFAPGTVLFSETTAGALILLSIAARGLGWRWLALGAAVAALFIRELVAPFVVVSIVLALLERRRGEIVVWGAALAAYGGYFLWHAHMVGTMLGPLDTAYPDGWIQFGGLEFVLGTAQINGAFWLMPLWVTAMALPLAVLGLVAWPGRTGLMALATVGAYLVLFSAIGKPANVYWGMLYAPLLAPGLAWAPAALRDLGAALVRPISAVA